MKHLHDRDIYKSKWCAKVRNVLDSTGLSYIWNWEGITDYRLKMVIKQKLSDAYFQNWCSDISDNKLCINYRAFKKSLAFEKYLYILDEDLKIPVPSNPFRVLRKEPAVGAQQVLIMRYVIARNLIVFPIALM